MDPLPNVGRFVSQTDLNILAKDATSMNVCETIMRQMRAKAENKMIEIVGASKIESLIRPYEHQVIRLLLGKSLHKDFPHTVSGRFTAEKANAVGTHWVKWLQTLVPALSDFASNVGIHINVEAQVDDDDVVVSALYLV